jgi:Fe-S-cluster containining protein
MAVFYECDRCTACCRWPGQVRLDDPTLTRLAGFLGESEFDFVQRYTRLRPDRLGLALKDKEDGSCIFLEDGNCVVQEVKPQQCRDFPNLWNFPGFEQVCRARPVEVTTEVWRERVRLATGREL